MSAAHDFKSSDFGGPVTPPPKPHTFGGDLAKLPDVFRPYTSRRIWVCWQWTWNGTKWTKPPYSPSGHKASSTDPKTWCAYSEALAAVQAGRMDGIGLSLQGVENGEIALDLDDCRDLASGEISNWAREIIEEAASYTEVTPSGTGVRVLGRGDVGRQHKRFGKVDGQEGGLEIYTAGEARYITVSGAELPGCWPNLSDISEITGRLLAGKGRLDAEMPAFEPRVKAIEPAPAHQPKPGSISSMLGLHPKIDLEQLIRNGAPQGQRSEQFHHAVGLAKRQGWTPEHLEQEMRSHPDGIASKYIIPRDRLAEEIARCWVKVDAPPVEQPPSVSVLATPYEWPDPASLPPRAWLYGRHLIRRFVSCTVAPGGVGKTSLTITDALAMVSGRNLIGSAPEGKLNVWLFNGEDPLDELQRRIAATAKHYGITRESCESSTLQRPTRLYVDSGRDKSLVIARQLRDGVTIQAPVVEAIEKAIREREIDVLIIDPFVSCHEVAENDNGAIDKVAKAWAAIAHRTGCAIDLVHHSRKTGGEEVTVEHARGAVALIAAARSARVLNRMTEEEAAKAGLEGNHLLYFNTTNGKSNLAPPAAGKAWFEITSVELGNGGTARAGDSVGVVTPWSWPDPLEGMSVEDLVKAQKAVALTRCREDMRSPAWAGHTIGSALGIDTSSPTGRSKVKAMLTVWLRNGMFKVVDGQDDKRNPRRFVEVGEWADE